MRDNQNRTSLRCSRKTAVANYKHVITCGNPPEQYKVGRRREVSIGQQRPGNGCARQENGSLRQEVVVLDDEEPEDVPVGEQVPLGAAEVAPVPTPVPEPPPPPPAEPVPPPAPAATPCEIAADALPQAGP